MTSEAKVATTRARRYLGQMAKHFAHTHERPTRYSETRARIDLDGGVARLSASRDALTMRVEATTKTDLAHLERSIAFHLRRFAFRDPPPIRWRRPETHPGPRR